MLWLSKEGGDVQFGIGVSKQDKKRTRANSLGFL
jgi:hypothetical protein